MENIFTALPSYSQWQASLNRKRPSGPQQTCYFKHQRFSRFLEARYNDRTLHTTHRDDRVSFRKLDIATERQNAWFRYRARMNWAVKSLSNIPIIAKSWGFGTVNERTDSPERCNIDAVAKAPIANLKSIMSAIALNLNIHWQWY